MTGNWRVKGITVRNLCLWQHFLTFWVTPLSHYYESGHSENHGFWDTFFCPKASVLPVSRLCPAPLMTSGPSRVPEALPPPHSRARRPAPRLPGQFCRHRAGSYPRPGTAPTSPPRGLGAAPPCFLGGRRLTQAGGGGDSGCRGAGGWLGGRGRQRRPGRAAAAMARTLALLALCAALGGRGECARETGGPGRGGRGRCILGRRGGAGSGPRGLAGAGRGPREGRPGWHPGRAQRRRQPRLSAASPEQSRRRLRGGGLTSVLRD